MAYEIRRVELHHFAKFQENWSIYSGDFTIFSIFQDGGRRHLGSRA